MLQHDRCRLRPGPAEPGVIAMAQGSTRRVERLDKAGYRLPVPGRPPRNAGRAVAPQASRAYGDDGCSLAVQQLTPAIPAMPGGGRELAGTSVLPGLRPGCRGGVHAIPPGAAGPVSISTRQACTWAIEAFSFAASSRPDRWI